MRKVKGNIRKMLAAIVLTLLCCSAFAQRIVESGDLRTTTDEQHGTVVHYLKGGKRPLSGKFRILRGQDEEIVHFSKGVMQGEYRRFRNGSLREKGKYTDGRRHGLFVSYHQDGKTPQREAPMQYGKIDGTVRTWFSDGKPDMVQEYRQGKRNGKEQRFDPKSGKQSYEANYTDDRKEGKQWKISEDTTERWVSKTVSHYKNGELDGPYDTRPTYMASCTPTNPARTRTATSTVRGKKSTGTISQSKANTPRDARRDTGYDMIS